MKKILCLISLLLLIVGPSSLFGQDGTFLPINADQTFPRTLLDQEDIAAIQEQLSQPGKTELYQLIWNKANQVLPQSDNRRARSEISREAAFVVLMDRKIENNAVVPLLSDEREEFIAETILLLEQLNPEVEIQPGWSFYYFWQFRTKELIHYLIAYDLLRGAGVSEAELSLARDQLQLFAGNLHKRSIAIYPDPISNQPTIDFYVYNTNNHGLMTTSALGLAAIVLAEVESTDLDYQPNSWINTAMWNMDNILWREDGLIPRVSDPGVITGYAEGPSYFNYCFVNVFPFLRAMWNFLPDGDYEYVYKDEPRTIKHPWYDSNFHNLYEWMNLIRLPNGGSPAIHDSPYNYATSITVLAGQSKYNIESIRENFNSIWTRAQYLSTPVESGSFDKDLFQVLPEAGSVVYRSAYNDPSATYMHMIAKKGIALLGAKAHHQADATSFQIYHNEEILALDPGYPGSVYREHTSESTDHNLILVNGTGPGIPLSEWVATDNTVDIAKKIDLPKMDFSQLNANWQETDLKRKTGFVNDRYFFVVDECYSENINDYTFQLHGHGLEGSSATSAEGSFEPKYEDQLGIFTRGTNYLLAQVTSDNPNTNYSTDTDSLAIGSNNYRLHSTMLVNSEQVQTTKFLSVLFPEHNAMKPRVSTVNIGMEKTNIHRVDYEDFEDFIFTQNESTPVEFAAADIRMPVKITSDAQVAAISFKSGTWQSCFVDSSSQLQLGEKMIFDAPAPVTLALNVTVDGDYEGFIDRGETLTFYGEDPWEIRNGAGQVLNYDPANGATEIWFSEAGYFTLTPGLFTSTKLPNVLTEGVLNCYPNPVKNILYLDFYSIEKEEITISIVNLVGQRLQSFQRTNIAGLNQLEIPVSDIQSGAYLLEIKSTRNESFQKVIIDKE